MYENSAIPALGGNAYYFLLTFWYLFCLTMQPWRSRSLHTSKYSGSAAETSQSAATQVDQDVDVVVVAYAAGQSGE